MQKLVLFTLLCCLLTLSNADKIIIPTKHKSTISSFPNKVSPGSKGATNTSTLNIPLKPSNKKQTYYLKCTVSTRQSPQCIYLGTSL
nr:hypothetical transcript [Hymenolepis microstoma]